MKLQTYALKALIIFVFSLATIHTVCAQIPLDVSVNTFPPYPKQYSVWASNANTYMITIINNSDTEFEIYPRVKLTGFTDNFEEVFVNISDDFLPQSGFIIPANSTRVISAMEIESAYGNVDISDLDISDNVPLDANGELPSGDYELCVDILDFRNINPASPIFLSPQKCSDGFGVTQNNIQLEWPYDDSELPLNIPINFSWSTNSGLSYDPSQTFVLKLYEIDSIQAQNESIYEIVEEGFLSPIYTSQPTNQINLFYDFSFGVEDLKENYLYAWQVEIENTNGVFFDNSGKSNIHTFYYGIESMFDDNEDENPISQAQADCFENCVVPISNNTNALSDENPQSFTIGHFTMDSLVLSSASGGYYSGTGRINIEWLNEVYVNVTYNNLRVNSDYQVIQGEAIGTQKDDVPTVHEEFNDMVRSARVGAGLLGSESTVNLPIGIDYNIAGTDFLFGLTEMKFTPESSTVKAVCNFHMPAFGEDSWISVASSETCMHPGGFGNEFILHMDFDRPFNMNGDVSVAFKGSQNTDLDILKQEASYMQMNCNGLQEVSLKADVFFPESMLVPDTEDGIPGDGQVMGNLGITIGVAVDEEENVYAALGGDEDVPSEAGLHFIGQLSIDSFQIKNIEGWGFEVVEAYIDASELMNPPEMNVPENYEGAEDGTLDELWTGFYLKKMRIAPPKDFLGGNTRITGAVRDAIIDEHLTMQVGVENVFDTNEGNIKDWSLSMDWLYLDIVQNTLTGGGFDGQLGTPITGDGEFLDYSAVVSLTNNNGGGSPLQYVFTVNPSEDITMPFMLAEATLHESSYVQASVTPGNSDDTYIEFHPSGELTIDTDKFPDNDVFEDNGGVPLKLPLVDFSFKYNTNIGFSDIYFALFNGIELTNADAAADMDFTSFGNGLTSNEENLVGLPITLSSFNIVPDGNNFKAVIEPHVILCPGEFGFGASTVLNFPFKLKGSEHKKFKLTGFEISGAQVDAAVLGLNISGGLEFYDTKNADDYGSKGARGNMKVILPFGMGVKMAAEFGNIVTDPSAHFNTAKNFQYWYVDGMVYFGNFLGMPIGGPLSIYGLGGGISYNMTRSREGNNSNETASMMSNVSDPSMVVDSNNPDAADVRRTGIQPIPAFGKMGMKFAATIGTSLIPSLFNADVSIQGEVNIDDGAALTLLSIQGDGFLLTPIANRYNPKFWASVALTFENPRPGDFSFHGGLTTYLKLGIGNFTILKGNSDASGLLGPADFHVQNYNDGNNKKGFWYIHAGNPDTPFGAKIGFDPLSVSGSVYAMVGHNLPTELPVPDEIENLFGNLNSKGGNKLTSGTISGSKNRSGASKQQAKDGSGLAFGAKASVDIDLDALGIYAKLAIYMGFDINLTHSESRTCFSGGGNTSAPGVNGWYGQGQIYAGLEGGLGFRFKFAGKKHDLELFGLSAAMMLSGGGPDPWWAEGRVGLQIRVLGGMIKCTKTISVRVGEQCIPAFNDPFGGIPLIADISPAPETEGVSQFSNVNVVFALPMNVVTEIPSIDPFGNTYTAHIEPSYTNLKWKKQNGTEIDYEAVLRKANKRLDLTPDKSLLKDKEYSVEMRLIAYEYPFGYPGAKIRVRDASGSEWFQDTIFTFKTGESVDLTDAIETSIPIRNQKYFLQDEILTHEKRIKFNTEVRGNEFFPVEDDLYNYSYQVRYIPENGDPIEVNIPNPGSTEGIYWNIPDLENNMMYGIQMIQVEEAKSYLGAMLNAASGNLIQYFNLNETDTESYDVTSDTEVTLAEADVLPELANNENAMFTYFFKTSEFNTLSEKLSGATSGESWLWWAEELTLNTEENFDEFDINGEFNEDDVKVQSSLINIYDPMQKEKRGMFIIGALPYTEFYQERIDDEVWRFINKMTNNLEDHPTTSYFNQNILINDELPILKQDYAAQMENRLTKQVLNYDAGLDEDDIANFGGSFFIIGDYTPLLTSGTFSTGYSGDNVKIYFKTMDDVQSDAQELYEYGLDFQANPINEDWIDTYYDKFYTHHSALIPYSYSTIGYQFYLDFYHSKFKDQLLSEKGYSKKELTWDCEF